MHSNDPQPISGAPDAANRGVEELTEEEMRLYKEALETAFPHPSHHLAPDVMAAVRKEEARKKNQRRLILRWGSLAACVALVALVGIKTLPSLLSPDKIAYDAAENGSYAATYKSTDDALLYSAMLDSDEDARIAYGGSEEVPEMAVETEIVVENDNGANAKRDATDTASGVITEDGLISVSTTATDVAEPECEEVFRCAHENAAQNSYHNIPEALIREVGREPYDKWAEQASKDDPCGANIYAFIQHFQFPAITFTMLMQTTDLAYFYDYPQDLLYGEDAEAVAAYYEKGGNAEGMLADGFEYELKKNLALSIGEKAYKEWLESFPLGTVRSWSMARFLQDHGFGEGDFIRVYNKTVADYAEIYPDFVPQEYDTLLLLIPNVHVQQAASLSTTGYAADVLCRK